MAIALIGSAKATGTGTAVSVTHGLTIVSGDILVAFVVAQTLNTTIADNNGSYPMAQDLQENQGGADPAGRYAIWHRVAGASEPAAYAWTLSASKVWTVEVRQYRGVDSSVWDVAPATATRTFNTSDGHTATAPSITIVTAGACGLLLAFTTASPSAWGTLGNGYGDAYSNSANPLCQGMADKTGLSTGATGTSTFYQGGNANWAIHQVALKPLATGVAAALACTVPAPSSSAVLGETLPAALTGSVPAPSAACVAAEAIPAALACSIPAPTCATVEAETFAAALACTVPAPTSLAFASETEPAAVACTLPAPTSAIVAGEEIAAAITCSIPAPTCAETEAETEGAALACTIPAPTCAIVAAESLAAIIAVGIPAPVSSVAMGEAVAAVLADTVPAPTCAVSATESVAAALSCSVPAPSTSMAMDVPLAAAIACLVPAPTSALTAAETFAAAIACLVPAPSSALLLWPIVAESGVASAGAAKGLASTDNVRGLVSTGAQKGLTR